jgi:hypothetical protein
MQFGGAGRAVSKTVEDIAIAKRRKCENQPLNIGNIFAISSV